MYKTYMKAVGALYGDKVVIKKKRKRRHNFEETEQIILVTWLAKKNILFYHVPNGGSRHRLEAFKLKRMGLQGGVPDICIPVPSKGSHSLYIELKRKEGGVTSPSQKYWLEALNSFGHKAVVCHGADEAIKMVTQYLDM